MTAAAAFFIFLLLTVLTRAHESQAFGSMARLFQKNPAATIQASSLQSSGELDKSTTATGTTASSTTRGASLRWWEDLPPFRQDQDLAEYDDDLTADANADVTHFCFLVHGHRGLSKDLRYVQATMRRVAANEKKKMLIIPESHDQLRQDMVVHSVCCNEGKTTDGVVKGGERLVDEIVAVIRQEMVHRPASADGEIQNVTISVLGNSLGGIYGRYAIARLVERCLAEENSDCYILDETYRLSMNIFCTTATPHLGVAGHTFLPLPRTAEIGVAHAMGDTGKDLFRLNDLMRTMATHPDYLKPLGSFRKRIAYANAFGTDFPVPTNTAAFLHEGSTYPHHFLDDSEGDQLVVDDNGLVIATLHTAPKNESKQEEYVSLDDESHADDLVQMSTSLDSLGWKKVFVDVRKEVPNISLPKSLRRLSSNNGTNNIDGQELDDSSERLRNIDILKQRGVVSSGDVAAAVKAPMADGLHWPVGHNMIVAFSRSPWSTYMNKGGRPVVDALAKELVKDIFTWIPSHHGPISQEDEPSQKGPIKELKDSPTDE